MDDLESTTSARTPEGISRARLALKRRLKLVLGTLAGAWPFGEGPGRLRVLHYHRVNPYPFADLGPVSREITVTPQAFEDQLRWLKRDGWQGATEADVEAAVAGRLPPGPKRILITFDDGFEDNYIWAFPLLKRYGFRAAIFPATRFIGAERGPGWAAGDAPGRGRFLKSGQLREMHAAGMWIASHSHSHPLLTQIDAAQVKDELRRSRETLQGLGISGPPWFAYPAGDEDEGVRQQVADSGYRLAFTTVPGHIPTGGCDPLRIPRTEVSASDSPPIFRMKLKGRLDWTRIKESRAVRRVVDAINAYLIRRIAGR